MASEHLGGFLRWQVHPKASVLALKGGERTWGDTRSCSSKGAGQSLSFGDKTPVPTRLAPPLAVPGVETPTGDVSACGADLHEARQTSMSKRWALKSKPC